MGRQIIATLAMLCWLLISRSAMAAIVITESFEAAPGYDNAGWSASAGAGCSVDEDSVAVARPTGGGNQVLLCAMANTGNTARTYKNVGADKVTTYGRVYFQIDAWTTDTTRIVVIRDSAFNSCAAVQLETTGAVQKLGCTYRTSAGTQTVTSANVFATNTWYIIEWWYYQPSDANDTLAMRVTSEDGTLIEYLVGTDAVTPQALTNSDYGPLRTIELGNSSDFGTVANLYHDLLEINDGDGWIGSEGGAPAAAPPRRRGQVMIISGIPDPPRPWWNRLRDWLTPRAWALRRTE